MKRLTIITLSLVFITACRKDPQKGLFWNPRNPDCENYNPCFGVDSFQADFYIGSTGLHLLTSVCL